VVVKIADLRKEGKYLLPGSAACPGCGLAIAFRIASKVLGKNTIYFIPACCTSVIQAPYPKSAFNVPVYNVAFMAAAAAASGAVEGLKALGKKDVQVVVWAGDGGTVDIGIQALSGAFERNLNFIYICYDNEAYMNTGIQKSGSTPFGAWTTTTPKGRIGMKKNMPFIVASHGAPYVATASIGYPLDLANKIEKARGIAGPKYIHILAPCPPGWRFPMDKTIRVGKLAVDSYIWPLYEIESGRLRITMRPRRVPVEEYLKLQGRFKDLTTEEIEKIKRMIDEQWEILQKLESIGKVFP